MNLQQKSCKIEILSSTTRENARFLEVTLKKKVREKLMMKINVYFKNDYRLEVLLFSQMKMSDPLELTTL